MSYYSFQKGCAKWNSVDLQFFGVIFHFGVNFAFDFHFTAIFDLIFGLSTNFVHFCQKTLNKTKKGGQTTNQAINWRKNKKWHKKRAHRMNSILDNLFGNSNKWYIGFCLSLWWLWCKKCLHLWILLKMCHLCKIHK